jgi:hypothetical protein
VKFWFASIFLAVAACVSVSDHNDIAVGAHEEMQKIVRPARACGALMVRADPLSAQNTVFVTYGASSSANSCVQKWVRQNLPHTEATPQRWRELGFDVH